MERALGAFLAATILATGAYAEEARVIGLAAGDRRVGNVESIVADQLERLSIAPADVREIIFDERRETFGDEHRVIGVDAWVRLNRCPRGALIVSVRRNGIVRDVYTRGMCAVPGVAQFGD